MSESLSEEAPVYRGKTLTPESPRPLHVPSPANIPILENQIDPIFNLMSTHADPPITGRDPSQGDQEMADEAAKQTEAVNISGDGDQDASAEYHEGAGPEHVDPSLPDDSNKIDQQSTVEIPQFDPAAASKLMNSDEISATNANPPGLEAGSTNPLQPEQVNQEASQSGETFQPAHENTISENSALFASTSAQNQPDANSQNVAHEGVQALLDSLNIPQLAQSDAALAIPGIPSAGEGTLSQVNEFQAKADEVSATDASTPVGPAGLPARPPPQDKPSIHPNYEAGADIRSFHFPQPSPNGQQNTTNMPMPAPPALAAPGANGLPAPPVPSFQHAPGASGQLQQLGTAGVPSLLNAAPGQTDANSPAEVEAKYHTFLDEESVFTAEGAWEKFPQGSRLFVGNLPTEIVTKRDIFDIFHKYGKLAQISIKQAYGFVQFMDAEACQRAMKEEQGKRIKERNMHLEISKPPKNSRNSQASAAGDRLRDRHKRDRSRSGERRPGSRAQRAGKDRNLPYSDFRDEPRRGRDDYRPGRSPSPRRRDDYRPRDRSSERYYDGRRRSRSPYGRGYNRRSPSPRRGLEDDDALPLPKRAPMAVPDVQIILVEEVNRAFIDFVVRGFRDKGIRCDVLTMPRVPLDAVIRRQILEGVAAVCKLTRNEERTGKVPLQVFDRSRGTHDVRFDEYENLEMPVAAELALRAKSTQAPATASYGNGPPTYVPPYMQQQAGQAGGPGGNMANLISNLDGPALQQLLSVMQQQQTTPTQSVFPQQPGHGDMSSLFPQADMPALLASMNQHSQPMQQSMAQPFQYGQSAQPQTPQQQAYSYYPNQSAGNAYGQPQHGQPQSQGQPQVQSIMDQLATLQRKG